MLMERGSGAMTRTAQVYTQNSQLSGTRKPAKPVEIVLRLLT